jgi:hypothetical protein
MQPQPRQRHVGSGGRGRTGEPVRLAWRTEGSLSTSRVSSHPHRAHHRRSSRMIRIM